MGGSGWPHCWADCGKLHSGGSGWPRCWADCGKLHSGGSGWPRCWAGCGRLRSGGSGWPHCWVDSGRLRSGGSGWPHCWVGYERLRSDDSGRPRCLGGYGECPTGRRKQRRFSEMRAGPLTVFSFLSHPSVRPRVAGEMSPAGYRRSLPGRGQPPGVPSGVRLSRGRLSPGLEQWSGGTGSPRSRERSRSVLPLRGPGWRGPFPLRTSTVCCAPALRLRGSPRAARAGCCDRLPPRRDRRRPLPLLGWWRPANSRACGSWTWRSGSSQ